MNRSRLAILAVVAVGIAIVAATQTCRDRSPAETTAASDVKAASSASGVAPRAADTPTDLRERDRLRDEGTPPAGVAPTPEASDVAPPPTPPERRPMEPTEPAVAPPLPASPTIEAAMAAAKEAAQGEIAKVHSEIRKACWEDFDRRGVGGDGVKLSLSLGIDAQGTVIASSVQQGREAYIDGIERCLAPFAHGITVPAPGESVSVDVDLELP